MRRGLIFVLLTACVGLGGGAVSAAPPTQTLVLRGSRTTSMVADFVRPVTFWMHDDSDSYGKGVSATLGGDYAGIVVRRLDGRLVFGRIVVRGFESTALERPMRIIVQLGDLHENVVIQPGRYRVSMVTDAPSELRFRTRGLPASRVLAPTGPEPRKIQAHRLELRAGVAPVGYGKVEQVEVGKDSSPVLATFREYVADTVQRTDYCFTNMPDCDVGPNGGHAGADSSGTAGGGQAGYGDWHWVTPGRWDVLFRVVGTGVPLVMTGFVLVLD